MDRKMVTIRKVLDILPIDGADMIELAKIDGWQCVVKKGELFKDQLCLYYEVDSFLPDIPEYAFLKKGSSLKRMTIDGDVKIGIRLKTIKLRGQLSQGLALPIPVGRFTAEELIPGTDATDIMGVIKYEPPIPAQLAGKVKGFFPGFIPKTDEERIQNMGEVLTGFYVTEKLDGSSVTFYKKDGVLGVCSRNLELTETLDNTQWKMARRYDLENKLPDNMAIQGELVGEGVQNNPYHITGQVVYFYNVYNIKTGVYLDYVHMKELLDNLLLPMVPVLDENFALPKSVEEMLKYAEGKSEIDPNVEREGVVVRPKTEMKYNGARFSFKAISNKFLLGETE